MQEGVDGYPTVKHFKDGDLVNDYHYARSFDRMKKYLQDKLYDLSKMEPNAIGVFELNDLSFQKMIESSGKTPIIVMFHVQWCQHCKDLKDVWEELGKHKMHRSHTFLVSIFLPWPKWPWTREILQKDI